MVSLPADSPRRGRSRPTEDRERLGDSSGALRPYECDEVGRDRCHHGVAIPHPRWRRLHRSRKRQSETLRPSWVSGRFLRRSRLPGPAHPTSFDPKRIVPAFAVAQWNLPAVHRELSARAKSTNGIWKVNGQDVRAHRLVVPTLSDQHRSLHVGTRMRNLRDVELKRRDRWPRSAQKHAAEFIGDRRRVKAASERPLGPQTTAIAERQEAAH